MGFLRRLLGGSQQQPDRPSTWSPEQPPAWMRDGMTVELCEGREDLEVVGEASYQDNLWRIVGGRYSPDGRVREEVYAVLAAEPDNPYDANAVAVWIQGLKVGYLSPRGCPAIPAWPARPGAAARQAHRPGRCHCGGRHARRRFGTARRLPRARSSGLRPSPHAHEPTSRVGDADRALGCIGHR